MAVMIHFPVPLEDGAKSELHKQYNAISTAMSRQLGSVNRYQGEKQEPGNTIFVKPCS